MELLSALLDITIQILVYILEKWRTKDLESDQFLTKTKFTKLVEKVVKDHRSSYMDAIIHLCEEVDVDLEDVRRFISPVIREKLEAEAMRLNYLPKQNMLPLD